MKAKSYPARPGEGGSVSALEWIKSLPKAPERKYWWGDRMPANDSQTGKQAFFNDRQYRVEWWEGGLCQRWETVESILHREKHGIDINGLKTPDTEERGDG